MLDAFAGEQWRKSTHGSQGVDCVEVAALPLKMINDALEQLG